MTRVSNVATHLVAAVVLAVCIAPSVAWADGDMVVVSETAERVVTQYDNAASKPTSQLGLSVSWNDPVCGQPTEFLVTTTNGSSQCEYRIDSVDRYTDDRRNYLEWVMDPSKFVYQTNPSFQLTFCASGTYRVRISVLDKGASPLIYENVDAWVVVDDPAHPSVEALADQVASDCLKAGNVTDFDKALWLHDWIIDNCEYDHSLTYCGAEGVFARGTGTCESYHRAYEMLLARVGIPTGRITGNGHVWTAVKLDGKWYQVDATWDDGDQFRGYPDLRHLYFGMNDQIVGLVHSDHVQPVEGYESSSLDQNYFIKTGKIREWSDSYVSPIVRELESGSETFSLSIDHASWPDGYKNAFYNLVAYDLSQREWVIDNGSLVVEVEVEYESDVLVVTKKSVRMVPSADALTVVSGDPVMHEGLVFNGSAQEGVSVDTAQFTVSGDTWAREAGEYAAVVSPRVGYAWNASGDRSPREYRWSVGRASLASDSIAVEGVLPSYVANGAPLEPKPVVRYWGRTLVAGADYRVSYQDNVSAGTAKLIVEGIGAYKDSRVISFQVTQELKPEVPVKPVSPGGTAGANPTPGQSVSGVDSNVASQPKGNWKKSGGKWWYRHADGSYTRSGWELIDGVWYHFDRSGWMQTGWLKTGGKWYYLASSGAMKTGWLKTGGTWYYLRASGAMATGWYQVQGTWYWSASSGAMGANRWVGNYYLTKSGAMATNAWIGKYHVNGSGKWDRTR